MAKGQLTQKKITKGLLTLLKDKPITDITVGELVEFVGVGRSTFYRYYRDIYDVYEQMLSDVVERATAIVRKFIFSGINPMKIMELFSEKWQIKAEGAFFQDDLGVVKHILVNDTDGGFLAEFYKNFTEIYKEYIMKKVADEKKAEFYGRLISKTIIVSYCYDFMNNNELTLDTGLIVLRILENLNSGGEL